MAARPQAACPAHMPSWLGGFVQGTTCASMSGSPATLSPHWLVQWLGGQQGLAQGGGPRYPWDFVFSYLGYCASLVTVISGLNISSSNSPCAL